MIVQLVTSAILALAVGAAVAVDQESSFGQAAVVKATGREARAHDGELRALAISPDGQTLAGGGTLAGGWRPVDAVIGLWSVSPPAFRRYLAK